MATIYEVADRHRRDLLKSERTAASRMIAAYKDAYGGIQEALQALLEQIEAARQNGEPITLGMLFTLDRLQAFERQALAQINGFAAVALGEITEQQRLALSQAPRDFMAQMEAAGLPPVRATFLQLPTGAINELVGFLSDGSPLSARLAQLAPVGAETIKSALIRGVTLGYNPRQTARLVREASAVPLRDALRISRTETLRAYREASQQTYEANDDVVKGWRWLASLSPRTCPMCLAMNGTFHKLGEKFGSHPNCRCCPVPETKTFAELGIVGVEEPPRPAIQDGEEWLRQQDAETQAQVLGRAGAEAWQSGKVSLSDFVRVRHSPKWGTIRDTKPLSDVLASGV